MTRSAVVGREGPRLREKQAARRVRDGAASARFDHLAGDASPVDLAARRDRPSDDLDVERWLDEGGSLSSEAVARWVGRQRVYFELEDDRSDDPVMSRVCPGCGHGLPGKSPA